jgi:hypothetical protein
MLKLVELKLLYNHLLIKRFITLMKYLHSLIVAFFAFSVVSQDTLKGGNLEHTLSNQGFTGIINTPNAMTMKTGDVSFHIDNQFDNALRAYDYTREYDSQEDYIFGLGVFSNIELQGRLSEAQGYHRDLSANIKIKLPLDYKYLPNIALGAQDIGSAANYYGNFYGVIDQEFWFVRASLGYGHSTVDSQRHKRMDGVFGGVEIKTFDWLYLLAENDSQENFAGIRIHMPKNWTSLFELNAVVSTNISDDYETSVSVNLNFPLYEDTQSTKISIISATEENTKEENLTSSDFNATIIPQVILKKDIAQTKNITLNIDYIKKELIRLGLENITIGTKGESIYVGYENSTFLFNELDAMGVVIGLLQKSVYNDFIIEPKHSGMSVFSLSGSLVYAREFYKNPNIVTKHDFTSSLYKSTPIKLNNYSLYVKKENSTTFKPKLEFSPVLQTFVGNEFGLFNYMLWLKTKFFMNLYKGVDFTATGNIHIDDSEIDDHSYDWFMKLYEEDSSIQSVMLHLSNNLFGGINTLSVGTFEKDFAGGVDQYIYNYDNHTFKLEAGYFKQFQDGDPYKEQYLGKISNRYLLMAKYSYLFDKYDTFTELNFGQYWNQDIGFDLKVKRFFGDIAVYVSFEQSKPYFSNSLFSEDTDRYAGIGFEIPLTFKHTQSYKYGQVMGTKAFDHQIKSTIAREDGTNTIVPGGNYNPKIALNSENYFYNRNRMQLSYIKIHSFRLVESYKQYISE